MAKSGTFIGGDNVGAWDQVVAVWRPFGTAHTVLCARRGPATEGKLAEQPWQSQLLETTETAFVYHQLTGGAPTAVTPGAPTRPTVDRRPSRPVRVETHQFAGTQRTPNRPRTARPPNIWGAAGGSLAGMAGVYGDPAHVGRWGEVKTAAVLSDAYSGDTTTHIFHDLHIPGSPGGANVDHMILRGNRLVILDTKVWAPGFYWTLGHRTRRGVRRFAPADRHTVGMAADRYRQLLAGQAWVGGMLVIHPSTKEGNRTRIWAMSLPDGVARVMTPGLIAALEERLGRRQPPGHHLITTLNGYLRRPFSPAPPGWHQDPTFRNELRYWNGATWTESVANQGQPSIDPL